ncbi:MAG: hypothetical protein KatS3mg111_1018 [Pirellulaceae bacterium]|nr:MAG: hypothetical protein KatS3mg111_1018 [Pirellulaceae bacterium]
MQDPVTAFIALDDPSVGTDRDLLAPPNPRQHVPNLTMQITT